MQKDIYNFYEAEAESLLWPEDNKIGQNLLKATGVFILATLIVFAAKNYSLIRTQLVEWQEQPRYSLLVADQDGDQMADWWEVFYGLLPFNSQDAEEDFDNDLVTNRVEFQNQTDPHNPDSDGDGFDDGAEIAKGYDPTSSGEKVDSDGDGMPDWWEKLNGLNPNEKDDAGRDYDGDGMSNGEEYRAQTNPLVPAKIKH